MDFDQAMDYIHSTCRFGSRLGLDNISKLLETLGRPQERFKSVHVAGTNGKGSTCAFAESILREAGYKTGLFTSPHLERFTERIRLGGKEIPAADVGGIMGAIKSSVDAMLAQGYSHPTEFELVTALGFEYFSREGVDYAVVEVGLGGRLDATNVLNPAVTLITSISTDHTDVLGDGLASISREKAGIIKKGVPVVLHPQRQEAMEVIEDTCRRLNAPVLAVGKGAIKVRSTGLGGQIFDFDWEGRRYADIHIRMLGKHQTENAAAALIAALYLGIPEQAVRDGLKRAVWPGRMEVLRYQPLVVIDGAHNAEGARALVEGLKQVFPGRKVFLVFGILRDKEVEKVAGVLASYADRVITVSPDSPRSMDPQELMRVVKRYNERVECAGSIDEAVDRCMGQAGEDEVIVFSGSLYMIGHVRSLLPPEIL